MAPEFILWSAALGGWFTNTATYSSDFSEAKRFSAFEASVLCMRFIQEGRLGLIPVREEDVRSVLGGTLSNPARSA